jgi:hypothetical protein
MEDVWIDAVHNSGELFTASTSTTKFIRYNKTEIWRCFVGRGAAWSQIPLVRNRGKHI